MIRDFRLALGLGRLAIDRLLVNLNFARFLVNLNDFVLRDDRHLLVTSPYLFRLQCFLFRLAKSLLLCLRLLFRLFGRLLLTWRAGPLATTNPADRYPTNVSRLAVRHGSTGLILTFFNRRHNVVGVVNRSHVTRRVVSCSLGT